MTRDHQTPDTATTAVALAHRFDEQRLYAYLKGRIAGLGSALEVRQFQGGTSNPTFLLTTDGAAGERRYVLRKKPPGALLSSAHQVDREFRVMKALADTDVPAPRMRVLCEDDSVIGTAFYVMDFLDGRIFVDASLPLLSPEDRAKVYDDFGRVLAALHQLDYKAVGLEDFGRPGDYIARKIGR